MDVPLSALLAAQVGTLVLVYVETGHHDRQYRQIQRLAEAMEKLSELQARHGKLTVLQAQHTMRMFRSRIRRVQP